MPQLHLTGILGHQITIDCQDEADILTQARAYGAHGYVSGEIPTGGYQLPLANEATFDWSLIGARKWTSPDGEELILHRGHSYRRRELDAVDSRKMKLPAAIKYSRGAKSTDPEHVREKSDGEFEYVTLIIFRGGGRAIEEFSVPTTRTDLRAPQAPRPAPQAAPAAQPARSAAGRSQHPQSLQQRAQAACKERGTNLPAVARARYRRAPSELNDAQLQDIIDNVS